MKVTYSPNILGRIFNGAAKPIDGGPALQQDPKVEIDGPSVNPVRRVLASRMVRTNVPMIDVFNTLVESQKSRFSLWPVSPTTAFWHELPFRPEADVVVFGGMGPDF